MGMFRPTNEIAVAFALCAALALAQPPKSLQVVNAASGGAVIAPDSISSAFGLQIGASTQSALNLPLPTSLSGVSLQITDSAQLSGLQTLIYVEPDQINFTVAVAAEGTST